MFKLLPRVHQAEGRWVVLVTDSIFLLSGLCDVIESGRFYMMISATVSSETPPHKLSICEGSKSELFVLDQR